MARRPPSPEPATAAAVALVLGDDDLLVEILLRLDLPTSLVRAALVCRRWLRRASAPAFLRRFRALHPPRVLGLLVESGSNLPRFLPVPQPEELAPLARRALDTLAPFMGTQGRSMHIWDCRNGRLLVEISGWPSNTYAVRSLLQQVPDRPLPTPPPPSSFYAGCRSNHMFLLEDNGDVTSCLYLTLTIDVPKVRADFSILQSGVWSVRHTAATELQMVPGDCLPLQIMNCQKLVVGRKVYMLTNSFILGLDLVAGSFFTAELPDGARSRRLSRAQHSGLYLIDAAGFHLRVWRGEGMGQWILEDTISVREACRHIDVPRWEPDCGYLPVCVVEAGDNAEFVILKLIASGIVCCMQLGNRIAEKVDGAVPDNYSNFIIPITLGWRPIFPMLDKANQEH
ncbi:hypothetical protein ACP70R_022132 [Stipagrostis hirtigluma subsp. patula]